MDRSTDGWSAFSELNSGYLIDLYERYRADPESIAPETRVFFERWGPPPVIARERPDQRPEEELTASSTLVAAALGLSAAIRMYGYRAALLDPLGSEPPGDTELLAESHGIREEDLSALPGFVAGRTVGAGLANALEAIRALRRLYQGTSGYEFEHVSNAEERNWLREAVESGRFRPPRDPIDVGRLLERLTQVEAFERFLQAAFPTQTRFSIEGLDVLVPMLDELVGAAAEVGTRQMMLGMAHRGRLNVLTHVLGKPYEQIIAEFMGSFHRQNTSPSGSSDIGWTGDVKYHVGARRAYKGGHQLGVLITLAPNPSHLEFIDPVVEGMTRAASERRDRGGPAVLDEVSALAVLIHGEAAFCGQGIVGETLNLSRLPGYRTGGTIHLIANNQLGFTTPPPFGRSTLFASDPAKGFEMPIIHVNADDPEACVVATRLCHAYVGKFHKDVLVDVIGYRRRGHNEGDEPSFTQPIEHEKASGHATVRELLARKLAQRGLVAEDAAAAMLQQAMEQLQSVHRRLAKKGVPEVAAELVTAGIEAGGTHGGLGHSGAASSLHTAVPQPLLARLNDELLSLPPDFNLHPKLAPMLNRRRVTFSDQDSGSIPHVEWSHAEALAFASILADGTPLRLSGQDTSRGTFSQRHLILRDTSSGGAYIPLQNIPSARATFEVWDSPLSEQATLGFEFGYSVQAPKTLVIWEAQYGDFVNAAQVIVDEFILSARSKWAQHASLVLLLPHGYEGQGPDHSSARIERFLQMAAEDNIRIANCTSSGQYFHVLRRQAALLERDPRPLVLFTPKSLLRNPLAASSPLELTQGRFRTIIDDPEARQASGAVRRLLLCSGKVGIDLLKARQTVLSAPEAPNPPAIVRVEELYPFPAQEIAEVVSSFHRLEEVVWVQEEPRNMGAWTYVAPRLRDIIEGRLPLVYLGRTRRASPAEGSHEWYVREQKRLVDDAFLRSRAMASGERK